MKNLPFEKLQHSTQQALLNDPAVMLEPGALRVYVPSRRKHTDAGAVRALYCERIAKGDPTPTETTAQRFNVTRRRVRQLTQGIREGGEPFTAPLSDSPGMTAIRQATEASALNDALKAPAIKSDPTEDVGLGKNEK